MSGSGLRPQVGEQPVERRVIVGAGPNAAVGEGDGQDLVQTVRLHCWLFISLAELFTRKQIGRMVF